MVSSSRPAAFRGTLGAAPVVVAACIACLCTPAAAQDALLHTQPSIYVQAAGAERGTHALTLGATLPWRDWRGSFLGAQVRGYWDVSLSRWTADGMGGRLHTTVLEATPSFRFIPSAGRSPLFFDTGVGASMASSRYMTRAKAFSTRFNFATHIGAGVALGEQRQHEIQLRIQHFSNGGFKDPNPGENFVQLRYALHF